MRVAVLYSGGKDSTYAAWLAQRRDSLVCLMTLVPKREDSWMFHHPNVEWTKLQAEAAGISHVLEETTGIKEEELSDLRRVLRLVKENYSISGLYTGALSSVYQKSRVERICSELEITCISPLWSIDPEDHLRNLMRDGFHVIVTAVSALGLNENWLGRTIDESAIRDLMLLHKKYGLHIALEGGEGETFVLNCPLFRNRIEILSTKKNWKGDRGYLEITEARLATRH